MEKFKRRNVIKALVNNKVLNDRILKEVGLTDEDIKELIDYKLLIGRSDDYTYHDYEAYLDFSEKLMQEHNYYLATKVLLICFNINPGFSKVTYHLFVGAIYNDRFDEAFYYLDYLLTSTKVIYRVDALVYLYLLNFITEVPERFKPYLNEIKSLDVLPNDFRYVNINLENELRNALIKRDLVKAENYAKSLKETNGIKTQERLIIHLTLCASYSYQNDYRDLLIFVSNGNVYEATEIVTKYRLRGIPFIYQDEYEFILEAINRANIKLLSKEEYQELCSQNHGINDHIISCGLKRINETIREINTYELSDNFKDRITEDVERLNNYREMNPEDALISIDVLRLKNMSKKVMEATLDYLKQYDDVIVPLVAYNNSNQYEILLKGKTNKDQNIYYDALMDEGIAAYEDEQYTKCITIFKKLLRVMDQPDLIIYMKIGLSYMKLSHHYNPYRSSNLKQAIYYLQLVTALNYEADDIYDFTDLINRLKTSLPFRNHESMPKMEEEDFNETYDEEEINEVIDLFHNKRYKEGDLLLDNLYKKTIDPVMRKKLNNVKASRNFYQYR